MPSDDDLALAAERARAALLAARVPGSGWRGQLSSSALSTATAVLALVKIDPEGSREFIDRGLAWLKAQQWASGGWGDTDRSLPNISTSLLAWAAFGAAAEPGDHVERAERWIVTELGTMEPKQLAGAILARYGKDQTFSVPILMACALGNRLGPSPACWQYVPQLPCELAAFPRRWFAALQLPVVSYALPALIAIGHVRHFHHPQGLGRLLRNVTKSQVFRLLEEIQPASGGYLEATPLTSFVAMALGAMEQEKHPVATAARRFLHESMRPDGSWPIDTDLATWVTSLAINALQKPRPNEPAWAPEAHQWLLAQQTTQTHPFTLSAPGAWAWTDLTGGVPDADDTSAALIALKHLQTPSPQPAKAGINWLLNLQNRDGGIPTFCRGWGALPFDRSTAEITAHALHAWHLWQPHCPELAGRLRKAKTRAFRYLNRTQQPDGSWIPLWFGQERAQDEVNKIYGTATVLKHLLALPAEELPLAAVSKAVRFLISQAESPKPEWAWGVEETALVILALHPWELLTKERLPSVEQLLDKLLILTANGTRFPASPIGLYFARLWYHEQLYPIVWAAEAFRCRQ